MQALGVMEARVFLVLLLLPPVVLAFQEESTSQVKEILMDVYKSTGGPHWNNNHNWGNMDVDYCKWVGIYCNQDNGIKTFQLILDDNRLIGTIPSSIGDLNALTYLDLSCNSLFGSVPATIGNLPQL